MCEGNRQSGERRAAMWTQTAVPTASAGGLAGESAGARMVALPPGGLARLGTGLRAASRPCVSRDLTMLVTADAVTVTPIFIHP